MVASLVYGTNNPAKLQAMRECLAPTGIEVVGIAETRVAVPEAEEHGHTPLENARIKALSYYAALRRPVFACDSGLYIDGLPESRQPGVYVRTVNGRRLSDEEMISYYAAIAGEFGGKVSARYKNAICLVISENETYERFGNGISGEKFYLVDTPHQKRIEGFPLGSLSVDIKSGEYYYQDRVYGHADATTDGFQEFFRNVLKRFPC
ncbi:MAG: hypothetical protein LBR83_00145 [Clostridiales bacterium]|jgi:8-oxo-dGTP diphosphatase|nr:hypothetical protein [Clostridiales bacterium]